MAVRFAKKDEPRSASRKLRICYAVTGTPRRLPCWLDGWPGFPCIGASGRARWPRTGTCPSTPRFRGHTAYTQRRERRSLGIRSARRAKTRQTIEIITTDGNEVVLQCGNRSSLVVATSDKFRVLARRLLLPRWPPHRRYLVAPSTFLRP